eukprot:CFRG3522T1
MDHGQVDASRMHEIEFVHPWVIRSNQSKNKRKAIAWQRSCMILFNPEEWKVLAIMSLLFDQARLDEQLIHVALQHTGGNS